MWARRLSVATKTLVWIQHFLLLRVIAGLSSSLSAKLTNHYKYHLLQKAKPTNSNGSRHAVIWVICNQFDKELHGRPAALKLMWEENHNSFGLRSSNDLSRRFEEATGVSVLPRPTAIAQQQQQRATTHLLSSFWFSAVKALPMKTKVRGFRWSGDTVSPQWEHCTAVMCTS